MEQKPHKKEELMVANSVLKLAEDLLKVTINHSTVIVIRFYWTTVICDDLLNH